MYTRHTFSLLLILVLGLGFAPGTSGPQPVRPTDVIAGQTLTLLPDGRWLLIGGEGPAGPLDTVILWDPHAQTPSIIPELTHGRAWHTATLLPDGTIVVVGGVDASGRVVDDIEIIDPAMRTVLHLPATDLTPRAFHTATLLTDGHVLLVGGISTQGAPLATAELWGRRRARPWQCPPPCKRPGTVTPPRCYPMGQCM